jgi:hypothetical protein
VVFRAGQAHRQPARHRPSARRPDPIGLSATFRCPHQRLALIRFRERGRRIHGICVNGLALARGDRHHVGVGLHMDVWSVLYAPHFASCAFGAICTSNLDDCVLARFVIVAVVRFLVPICTLCVPVREHRALALVSELVIEDVSDRLGCVADELVAKSDRHLSTAAGQPCVFGIR